MAIAVALAGCSESTAEPPDAVGAGGSGAATETGGAGGTAVGGAGLGGAGQGGGVVDLLGSLNPHPPLPPLPGGGEPPGYAGIAGYSAGGREYALLAGHQGLSVIDVSVPASPNEVVYVPMVGGSTHRDVVVHESYAYVGGQELAPFHIVDLSALPASAEIVGTLPAYESMAHTMEGGDGFLLINTNGGLCVILDLSDPLDPTEVGTIGAIGMPSACHDTRVQSDTLYVAGGTNERYSIYDIADQAAPALVGETAASAGIHAHSVALSADGNTLYAFEENNVVDLLIFDVSDPAAPAQVGDLALPGASRIHSGNVADGMLHVAYYEEGLVVFDVLSEPHAPAEIGRFDTVAGPTDGGGALDETGYRGAWSVYTDLPSGIVLLSDSITGLYVFSVSGSE